MSLLWPILFRQGLEIAFAHTSFQWSNLASHNAGVTVAIIGIRRSSLSPKFLWHQDADGSTIKREGTSISPYLTLGPPVIVEKHSTPVSDVSEMEFGNTPSDGGHLLLDDEALINLELSDNHKKRFIRRIYGSTEFINGLSRHCVWIEDEHLEEAQTIPALSQRIEAVRKVRLASPDKGAHALAKRPHQLKLMRIGKSHTIVVPGVSSEQRPYLPVGLVDNAVTLTNKAFGLYDAPLWSIALIASRLHRIWIGTVCSRLRTDPSYSNTLGWNTFPVPTLTEQNKSDLTRCAEEILLARESHFPATIADLYDPENMPADLRAAHERNDETLERIYIGRRFKNDTERLEKLFELYTEMTARQPAPKKPAGRKKKGGA